MAGFLKQGERILKHLSEVGIKQLEFYYGLDLEIYRTSFDEYADVYGVHAGGKEYLVKSFTGVVVSDDMFGSENTYSGNFEEGFLYTSDKEPKVGDVIKIVSDDSKIRRFKIIAFETIGTQTEILGRFKLSNLAH